MKVPILHHHYLKKVAKLKRNGCLLLHRFGLLKPLRFVEWLATYDCNLHCPYCDASAGKAATNELTTEEVKRLIDELNKMNVKRFVISGGEPLLRPDLIDIMGYACRRNLKLGLVTNGFFIEDQWNELRRFKYFLYFTSIDGTPEYSNQMRGNREAFERTMKGLELFGQLGVPTRIVNTVVHSGNIDQLESLLKIIKDSTANWWRLSPVSKVGRAANESRYSLTGKQLRYIADFIKLNKKVIDIDFIESHTYLGWLDSTPVGKPFFCGAGLTKCSIMPGGEVMGCHQVYDISLSEGNIREKPLSKIWKEGFRRFREKEWPAPCRTCSHLDECLGGCWSEMEKQGGCLKSVWKS